jgi:CoA:oxalate CoA-transferase
MAESACLSGIRVLDLTRFVAGPYCTMLLADAGAEVIKIEPIEGEVTRTLDPLFPGPTDTPASGYFLRFNRAKKSVCLDLKQESGRRVFADLVRHSDVVVENFRPDVLSRLGFCYDTLRSLNPRIIYCSISGFGHTAGPLRTHASFAILAEVMAGLVVSGDDGPIWTGIGIGDMFPGVNATAGIAMSLYRRERTGLGAHLDIAMYDSMISLNERAVTFADQLGTDIELGRPGFSVPFGLFEANDGWMCIAVAGDRVWRRFCEAIDHPEFADDERLRTGDLRTEHLDSLLGPAIDEWLATRTRDEATDVLTRFGVPAGPVRRPSEVLVNPQAETRHMLVDVADMAGNSARVAASPIRVSDVEAGSSYLVPATGEHTDEVLGQLLGHSPEDLRRLRSEGAIA